MSDSVASLRHQIASAQKLESVVRTMKTMASSAIGQYESAVRSLDDYYRIVQLGLTACLSNNHSTVLAMHHADNTGAYQSDQKNSRTAIGVIVFGSDQGLVGQFNEAMVEYVVAELATLPGKKLIWTVGERLRSRLAETALSQQQGFTLPNSINAITAFVGKVLIEIEAQRQQGIIDQVHLFHHRPQSGAIYTPVRQQLLPLDETWQRNLAEMAWPTRNLPQVMPDSGQTLRAFVREYLFVSLFRACAESLASENASRLSAMQRAEKNIDELQDDLNRTFHRLRQSGIDEELFDVLSGFEALS